MDDTEAEAVLLALGTALTWEDYFVGTNSEILITSMGYTADYADHLYTVGEKGDQWSASYRNDHQAEEDEGPLSPSCQAAKTACERHYATGKWD